MMHLAPSAAHTLTSGYQRSGVRQTMVHRVRRGEGDAGCVKQLESPHLGIAGPHGGEASCARGGIPGVSGAVLQGEKRRHRQRVGSRHGLRPSYMHRRRLSRRHRHGTGHGHR